MEYRYLDIRNGKLAGYEIPQYYGEAVKFAEEVKRACEKGASGTGTLDKADGTKVRLYHTNYKLADGTRFVLTYNKVGDLIEIEAKDAYDDDFETVYYNRHDG